MDALGWYLFKSAAWLTTFGVIYLLFLKNERFFLLNRIFLLSGLVASLLFPLYDWHYQVEIPMVNFSASAETTTATLPLEKAPISGTNLLFLFYGFVGILFAIKLVFQTLRVWHIIRRSVFIHHRSVKVIRSEAYPVSFSFFTYVIVNPSIHEAEAIEIIRHETEHVRQRHWIDLALFEFNFLLQWFNPMLWLYGKFIRQNHEYLADRKALQNTQNPALYRAALLNQMFGGSVIALSNSFNYSLNTKRFNMMKNSHSSPFRQIKVLLILPMMAMLFYAFATPEYVYLPVAAPENSQNNITIQVMQQEIPFPDESDSVKVNKNGSTGSTNGIAQNNSARRQGAVTIAADARWVEPDLKYESDTFKQASITVRGQGKQPLYIVDGLVKKHQTIKDINPATIQSIHVLKGEKAVEKYGEQAIDGAIEITLKSGMPNNFNYNSQGISVIGYKSKTESKSDTSSHLHTFLRMNGDASVIVEDSKDENPSIRQTVQIRDVGERPLLVLDGVIPEDQNINSVQPNDIESITVLKDKSATLVFGEKGKAGVILITRKKSGKDQSRPYPSLTLAKPQIDGNAEKINVSNSSLKDLTVENKPLIVRDGKIAEDQNIKEFGIKEVIEKINILKGKEATDRYGEMGRNGVIELTTKKERLDLELPKVDDTVNENDSNVLSERKLNIVADAAQKQAIVTFEGSSGKKRVDVSLYDKFGLLIQKERYKGPTFTYSLKGLATGTYFMVVEEGTNKYTGFLKY